MAAESPLDDRLHSALLSLVAALVQSQSRERGIVRTDGFLERLETSAIREVLSADDRNMCAAAFSIVVRPDMRDVVLAQKDEPPSISDTRMAKSLPGITRRLIDATPLSNLTRLTVPHLYTSETSVADALMDLRGRSDGFIAFHPQKGEMGLIAPEDFAIWFEHVVLTEGSFPDSTLTSLAQVFDLALRRWRTVSETLTVGQLRILFSNAAHRFDAVLVVDETMGKPFGIITAGDLALWQQPSHIARDRAQDLLDAERSRLNQMARTKRGSAQVSKEVPASTVLPTALLKVPVLSYEPLYVGPDGRVRIVQVVRELLASLGMVGATPHALLSALHGLETTEVVSSRLDTHPSFGCGVRLPASVVGDLLQLLSDHGYVVDAGPLKVRVASAWTVDADVSWLDESEMKEEPVKSDEDEMPAPQPVATKSPALESAVSKTITPRSPRKLLEPLLPRPYVAFQGQRQKGDFFKAANILSVTLQVIRFEGPIAGGLLTKRVVGLWGITSVTTPVRDRMSDALRQTLTRGGIVTSVLGGETFYMTSEQRAHPAVRTNKGAASGRSSGEMPPEEVRVIVQHLLEEGTKPRALILKGICAVFGLDASKSAPRRSMGAAVDVLLERGVLLMDGKMLALKE